MSRLNRITIAALACAALSMAAPGHSADVGGKGAPGGQLSPDGNWFILQSPRFKLTVESGAVASMDEILRQNYLSDRSIANEANPKLRGWMAAVSRLALSGNIVSAQVLVGEIAKTGGYANTAFPMLSRFVETATNMDDEHDEALFFFINKKYNEQVTKFSSWPQRDRECAKTALRASIFDDYMAYDYALQCVNPTRVPAVKAAARELFRTMYNLREGVRS